MLSTLTGLKQEDTRGAYKRNALTISKDGIKLLHGASDCQFCSPPWKLPRVLPTSEQMCPDRTGPNSSFHVINMTFGAYPKKKVCPW